MELYEMCKSPVATSRAVVWLCLLSLLTAAESAKDRVRLKDVEVLTLRKGEVTEARRSYPVPQLKCTGGCHGDKFDAAQCYNKGFDGLDVQWECKAEMPAGYRFGKLAVSCEGYDHPDDEYVLRGSCGLEYELKNTVSASSYDGSSAWPKSSGFSVISLLVICALAFVAYKLYQSVTGADPTVGPGDVPPPPYSRHEQPPPYGFGAEYIPGQGSCQSGAGNYNTGFNMGSAWSGLSGSASGPAAGTGGGFWTGAATGGVLGYMLGRRNTQPAHAPSSGAFPGMSSSTGQSSTLPQGTTHTATGYASTKRR